MARQRPSGKEGQAGQHRADRLAGFGDRASKSVRFSWGHADPVLMAGVVVAVTSRGGLASFGVTREGGAGTLTVFLDSDKSTAYVKPGDDVDAFLAEAVDYFANLD